MPGFSFWQRWLLVVGVIIAVFGVAMALLSGTPLFELFNRQIDPAFWGANPVGDASRQFRQWIYGVWGATIAGWGIFLTYMARYPFERRERWAWDCLFVGLLVWFVLDTALSLSYRVYFNVAFNLAVLVLTVPPIVLTRREFS